MIGINPLTIVPSPHTLVFPGLTTVSSLYPTQFLECRLLRIYNQLLTESQITPKILAAYIVGNWPNFKQHCPEEMSKEQQQMGRQNSQ